MRAIAIGLVIASHTGAERFVPGGLGVTLFFFISGYLITGLLIKEDSAVGKIDIASFYIRRFLRLGPALITMISAVSVGYFFLFGTVSGTQILAGLLYYTNFFVYANFRAFFEGTLTMPFWPLWSLAVEEHYYLIYPLIFAVAWKRRERFLAGLAILIIAVLVWRIVLVAYWRVPDIRTYFATDTRIDSILFGALLAVMLKTRFAGMARYFEYWPVVAAGALLLLLTLFYRDPNFRETFRYSLQGIALLPLFYAVLFAPRFSLARMALELPAMIWIGRLSYSLYLYHAAAFFFVATLLPKANAMLLASISLPTGVAAASLSYYCVEKHFQKLRERFRGEHAEDHRAPKVLSIQSKP
jgi:peptidoglycan/LPS O-acetylase OafA/YrhL